MDLVITGTKNWLKGLLDIAAGVLREIANQILQITVIQPLVKQISQYLTPTNGSFLGGILGFANGGIMTADGPLPLQAYSTGGIANSPQLALFGEGRMPEAYVPLPDGRRIPVAMQGGGGGGANVTVNVDAKGTSIEGKQGAADGLGRFIAAAVQQEILKQKRPGGVLAGGAY